MPNRTAFPKVWVEEEADYKRILIKFMEGCCPVADCDQDYEWQGRGWYEPVVWTARPEGIPLFGLKWVSPV